METSAMLQVLVQSVVDHPDDVEIRSLSEGERTTFQVLVHPLDVGKIVGKQGRMARALRRIVGANGATQRRSVALDIVNLHAPRGGEKDLALDADLL